MSDDTDSPRFPLQQGPVTLVGMGPSNDPGEDFDEALCLCQMKVVPEKERIDIIELREDKKSGKRVWRPVMRFHKGCPFHGLKVSDATRT